MMLKLQGLHTFYGNIEALKGLDLTVEEGEIIALLGANGAGKTTTLNSISGLTPPRHGRVFFDGDDITGRSPESLVARGLIEVPEGRRIFPALTVMENLKMGAYLRRDRLGISEDLEYVFNLFPILRARAGQSGGTLSGGEQQMLAISRALMRTRQARAEERGMAEFSMGLLEKYGLGAAANDLAKNLPYGDQRRLEIIRALATGPKLLLLDEPAAGLNIAETSALDDLIRLIREQEGLSILLIEHDMNLVMSVSEKVWVMEYGRLIAAGRPEEIKNDPVVIRAYLGEE
jgi:ABC-type branched-subunit amino acid transport system ATPase component